MRFFILLLLKYLSNLFSKYFIIIPNTKNMKYVSILRSVIIFIQLESNLAPKIPLTQTNITDSIIKTVINVLLEQFEKHHAMVI